MHRCNKLLLILCEYNAVAPKFYEVKFKITNTVFRKRKFTVFNVVALMVEALRYKLKVVGSSPDGIIGIFH